LKEGFFVAFVLHCAAFVAPKSPVNIGKYTDRNETTNQTLLYYKYVFYFFIYFLFFFIFSKIFSAEIQNAEIFCFFVAVALKAP
jgi:hypothetical protein